MDISMIGTIGSYMKNRKLEAQWNLKKQSGDLTAHCEGPDTMLKRSGTPLPGQAGSAQEDDGDGEKKRNEIMEKVRNGARLSREEKAYLRAKEPWLYRMMENAEQEQKKYAQELKRCKTKEEVQRTKLAHLSSVLTQVKSVENNPHIPEDKKQMILAVEKSHSEQLDAINRRFVRKGDFARLPTDAEKAEAEREERAAFGAERQPAAEQKREAAAARPEKQRAAARDREETKSEADVRPEKGVRVESETARKVRRAKARAAYAAMSGAAEQESEEITISAEA